MKRRVLITGGSRGIGLEIANLMKERNYEVVAPPRDLLNMEDLTTIDRFFAAAGGAGQSGFDILVNNAGINLLGPLGEIPLAQWNQMMTVNLTAPMMLLQKVLPHMREQKWGRIVNVSSIFSNITREKRAPYSASKSGLNGLTRTAAVELGPSGILVNAICPGYVETDLTYKNNGPADIERILAAIPLRRMAKPREIADMIEFLCSERNTYLTGQMVTVDGGFSLM